MDSRRNTWAAVLFLLGLSAAVIFLLLGVFPRPALFWEASRPVYDRDALPSKIATLRTVDTAIQNHVAAPLPNMGEGFETLTEEADPALNDLLDREHTFIELYGGGQRLMLRRAVEDVDPQYTVVKLTDQVLTFANLEAQPVDMTQRARELAVFARRVERRFGVPFLYVQAPSKVDMAPLPEGVSDYADEEADQVLEKLEQSGIDTLDLRPVFQERSQLVEDSVGELFFHTDHHWTPAGAFLGYQTLCEKLAEDYAFEIDRSLTDEDSFKKTTVSDVFLGSQGKRVGSLYAGVDDLEIWAPTFATFFTYDVPLSSIHREGPFESSLLFTERLAQSGIYDTNPYTVYAGDDYLLSRATNYGNPNAPRVLILRDSFGCAFTPFLALACGEVMAVDPRNFNGGQEDMMEYIDWLKPDMVIVMNTTSSLRVDELFPYLPSAQQAIEAKQAVEEEA